MITDSRATTCFLSILIACGGQPGDGDDDPGDAAGSLEPSAECEKYLSCVLVAAPESYAAQLALYGSDSECWKTPQQTMNCGQACVAAFQDIAALCTCTGTDCMPSTPQADCVDTHEPNDTLQTAEPVGASASGAICPAGDIDHFAVSHAGGTLIAEVTFSGGDAPQLFLLNGAGNAIINGQLTEPTVRLEAPEVPLGNYFLRITGSTKVDYELAITH